MPGGLLSDAARDVVISELVVALARALDDDDTLFGPDDGLDIEKATVIARDAFDALQAKKTMAITLTDDHGVKQTVMVQDLTPGAIDEIARKHKVGWLTVTDYPLDIPSLGVAQDLVRAAAASLKIKPRRVRSTRELLAMFDSVPDDVEDEAVEPDPLAFSADGGEDSTD